MTASQNGSPARRTGVHFYRFVAALAFAVAFGVSSDSLNVNAAEAANARRPNFLMIMCDQLNTFTMGVAGCDVKTPNIDRLAKEGTWFRIEKETGANIAYPTADWTPDDWCQYLWAYRMFAEGLDRYVGQLVYAVADSPQADNTIIVFISDHGDGAAAHRWNQKTALWEECIRVPFIICVPGGSKGVVDEHPVSSGIDLIPTLLELADLEAPDYLQGQSLAPVIHGRSAQLREYTVTETAIGGAQGRCVRTGRHKFIVYSTGADREQFFDLQEDPGEIKNLINAPRFADAIAYHRDLLRGWCRRTSDDFEVPGQ